MTRDHGAVVAAERDVHIALGDVLTIRLVEPHARDVAAFERLGGGRRAATDGVADVEIRFHARLAPPGLTYLGLNSAAFADGTFYVLDRKDGSIQASVPFATIGERCRIDCRRGLGLPPLFLEIVNLLLLKQGLVPLHASAFVFEETGVLVTGWTKGGKTELLLAFARHGARYVGDEWVVLSRDGRTMFGLSVPVTIWDWQLRQLPELAAKAGRRKRTLFRAIHVLDATQRRLSGTALRHVLPFAMLAEAMPALRRQLRFVGLPQTLFATGSSSVAASCDLVILAVSRSAEEIDVTPCSGDEVAARMAHSNAAEFSRFFEHYRAFRFAFPAVRNDFLDSAMSLHETRLREALSGKPSVAVAHPYPVLLEELFQRVQPILRAEPNVTKGQRR